MLQFFVAGVQKQKTMFRFFSIIQVSSVSFGLLRLPPWATIMYYRKVIRDNKLSISRQRDTLAAWKNSIIPCAVLHDWKRVCHLWENIYQASKTMQTNKQKNSIYISDFFCNFPALLLFTVPPLKYLHLIKDFRFIWSHHLSPFTLLPFLTVHLKERLHSRTVT